MKKKHTPKERISTNATEVAVLINIPTAGWVGNCHGIASIIVDKNLIAGKVERGYWKGSVHKSSIFYGRPLIPHSWIRMPNGKIADPTRWCFEGSLPYIFIGDDKCYDAGGNDMRMANLTPCPPFKESDKKTNIKFPKSCEAFVMILLGNPPYMTMNQAFWLGNLPLNILTPHATAIFTAFDAGGEGAIIPMDNYNIIMK